MLENITSEASTAGHSLPDTTLIASTLEYQEEHSTLLPELDTLTTSPTYLLSSAVHHQRENPLSLTASGSTVRPFTMSLNDTAVTPEVPVFPALNITGGRQRIGHPFDEPVTILIVLGVIAGIVGTILLIYYLISLITKKSSVDIQPPKSEDTDEPIEQIVVQEEHGSV